MDFDTMEAGPEMDALIAEKVMGYENKGSHLWRGIRDEIYEDWITTDAAEIMGADISAHSSLREFYPSRDIADAFEVLARFNGWELTLHLSTVSCNLYIYNSDTFVTVEADTTPLAICRAALKAVPH